MRIETSCSGHNDGLWVISCDGNLVVKIHDISLEVGRKLTGCSVGDDNVVYWLDHPHE